MSRSIYLGRETERNTDLDPVLITYLEAEFMATNNQCNQKKKWKSAQRGQLEAGGKWEQPQHCVFVIVKSVGFVEMSWRVEAEHPITIQISVSPLLWALSHEFYKMEKIMFLIELNNKMRN